jgi:hypothetical protein
MQDKTKKKKTEKEVQEEVEVHDLKPVKDAKGGGKGGIPIPLGPRPT